MREPVIAIILVIIIAVLLGVLMWLWNKDNPTW